MCADLFSGSGGFSSGISAHGAYSCVAAVDNWALAKQTYQFNHPTTSFQLLDLHDELAVRHLIRDLYGECDVIIGGPPCQGFSTLGKRMHGDKRSSLVDVFWKIVKSVRPRIAIMENVKTIRSMRHPNGATYPSATRDFLSTGKGPAAYDYFDLLIDAREYGLAQTRVRYLGVAVQKNAVSSSHFYAAFLANLNKLRSRRRPVLRDVIGDLPVIGPGEGADMVCIRRGKSARTIFNHRAMAHGPELINRLKHVPVDGGLLDVPVGLLTSHLRRMVSGAYGSGGHVKNIYGRLNWDKPCGTIVAGMDKITCGRFVHPEQHRLLTPRECARIQSFGDDYRFFGSLVGQYYQVGNAVPPKVAQSIAAALHDSLVSSARLRVA